MAPLVVNSHDDRDLDKILSPRPAGSRNVISRHSSWFFMRACRLRNIQDGPKGTAPGGRRSVNLSAESHLPGRICRSSAGATPYTSGGCPGLLGFRPYPRCRLAVYFRHLLWLGSARHNRFWTTSWGLACSVMGFSARVVTRFPRRRTLIRQQ